MCLWWLCTQRILLFSGSVVSDTLWPHGQKHTRLPCPSPSPGACSNSCALSWWCHATISSSIVPFLLLPSIFPSIKVFSNESTVHISWSNYWSFSFSISPSHIQSWFPLGLTVWSPYSPRDSQESSPAPQFESIDSSGHRKKKKALLSSIKCLNSASSVYLLLSIAQFSRTGT